MATAKPFASNVRVAYLEEPPDHATASRQRGALDIPRPGPRRNSVATSSIPDPIVTDKHGGVPLMWDASAPHLLLWITTTKAGRPLSSDNDLTKGDHEMKPDSLYRAPAGKRYHRPYCHTLEGVTYLEVTRARVLMLELTPCLVCAPPTLPPVRLAYTSVVLPRAM